jgi:Tfp pilus assembly protein PilO
MEFKLTPTNRAIIAVVVVAALGVAFWVLALGPKREEAKELGAQVEKAESSLAEHQAEVSEALEARSEFSSDYRQLVVLGKAVPGDDDTASLLVQLNRIGDRTGNRFTDFALNAQAAPKRRPPPSRSRRPRRRRRRCRSEPRLALQGSA